MLHEPGPVGQIEVPGPADRDGLDPLVAHDRAAPETAGAGPVLLDGGGEDPVLPGQADGRHLGVGLVELPLDQLLGLQGALAPEMSGIPDLHLAVVDPDVNQVGRLVAENHLVVTGVFQLRGPEPAHHGIGQKIVLGRDGADNGAVAAVGRGAAKKPGREDEQILRVKGLGFGRNPVPEFLDVGPQSSQKQLQIIGVGLYYLDISVGQVYLQIVAGLRIPHSRLPASFVLRPVSKTPSGPYRPRVRLKAELLKMVLLSSQGFEASLDVVTKWLQCNYMSRKSMSKMT